MAALQQEKEALHEEQRHHQALGASIESLVQEHLKTNERDKYSMFIGETADCHCTKNTITMAGCVPGAEMLTYLCLQETWRRS